MTTLTLQIKNIIRENSKSKYPATVYGNKYKTCRTVKTYATDTKNFPAIERALKKLAQENGVEITTKTTSHYNTARPMGCRPGSYIVRFPLDS